MIEIAIDVGGTFTDVVASADGRLAQVTKVPSTPSHLVKGVLNGVESILAQVDGSGSQVRRFVHGTTIGTNALLERKGARLAVLTSEGFDRIYGARPLRRVVQRSIENPLSRLILGGEFTSGDHVIMDTDGAGGLSFNKVGAAREAVAV